MLVENDNGGVPDHPITSLEPDIEDDNTASRQLAPCGSPASLPCTKRQLKDPFSAGWETRNGIDEPKIAESFVSRQCATMKFADDSLHPGARP